MTPQAPSRPAAEPSQAKAAPAADAISWEEVQEAGVWLISDLAPNDDTDHTVEGVTQ